MLISVSTEDSLERVANHLVDGQTYHGYEYIGTAPKTRSPDYGKDLVGEDYPQAYLVRQPPHSTTRPHFHQTNQFQVFVEGGGRVGKQRTDPVTVQFAGGNTPYGPICAEAGGISYFTLRQRWDSGAKYLPARRDALKRGQQRQRIGVTGALPVARGGVWSETLIAPEDDGLMSMRLVLAPGVSTCAPDGSEAGGQYHVVVGGSLERNGRRLGPLSVEFAFPDEGAVSFTAGPDGLDVLVLRFPVAPAA